MAWSTLRRATEDEEAAMTAAARRFCKRHGIDTSGELSLELTIECHISGLYPEDQPRMRRLWKRIVQRTLGNGAEGIAYGYVGFHVD